MPSLDWEEALGLLRTMWRIRHFEERVGQLKRADEVYGLIHLSVGQEAVAAGVCTQLEADDAIYSGHRAHGHAIAAGAPIERAMAELMGRVDGLCKGLGGSMHLVDTDHGLMGATGVVGGNIPMALGSALAARMGDGQQVAVVFFGDGAVQAGHFNESINLATLWELPVIFVCENNGFAEFTPRAAHSTVERVADVVAPYGLERETVDGNDVAAVRQGFARFLDAARRGGGPFLLECLTHRLRGHYEGDPQRYREALAQEEWQELDPIRRLEKRGLAESWLDDAERGRVEQEAHEEVEAAAKAARAHEFIMNLPEGYDTWIGERGVKLSVGQRQRVSIARVLLKDPPIVMFDEATSNIDTETEVKIREALDELTKGRTTIVIAHRLSTVHSMDRIIVLDRGHVVEDGPHEILMTRGGIYAGLYEAQFQT